MSAAGTEEMKTLLQELTDLTAEKDRLEEKEKGLRDRLRDLMQEAHVESMENSTIRLSFIGGFYRATVDRGKLKALFPEVEKQCTRKTWVESFVKVVKVK